MAVLAVLVARLAAVLLAMLPCVCQAAMLKNVSDSVFGLEGVQSLPLAFGDFNADKLTDIIVWADLSTIGVMLAKPQTFSLEEGTYFNPLLTTKYTAAAKKRREDLVCTINRREIVAAAPADFDGDGGMDVMVVTRPSTEDEGYFTSYILWGEHNQKTKEHRLVCIEESMVNKWHHEVNMTAEPLILDANGDNIADLFSSPYNEGENSKAQRAFWTFSSDRTQEPSLVLFEEDSYSNLSSPHSNAFIDLNSDGNADLFLTTEEGFELWENVGSQTQVHFQKHSTLPYPNCHTSKGNNCIGQSVFADFDLDGKLDMIFPLCDNDDCSTSSLYFSSVSRLWHESEVSKKNATDATNMDVPYFCLSVSWEEHVLDFQKGVPGKSSNPYGYDGLIARPGDINLDGYPDLLVRVRNKNTGNIQMHLLLNVEASNPPTPNNRGFILQPEIMSGLNHTVMATFYDLYENGLPDVIAVERKSKKDEEPQFRIGAFTNQTQDSDAFFVKVIVLSGICYHNCPKDDIQIPYGTNLPGQTICYRAQRQMGEDFREVESCAAQLPQTAHHALGLPYNIFGLGMTANFLDYMFVNISNASDTSHGKTWPQIIPNAQISVIPYPPDAPSHWKNKLFITPSKGITLTGLALIGTCAICCIIILLFHLRERRIDRLEKMQEANRFHFDAM